MEWDGAILVQWRKSKHFRKFKFCHMDAVIAIMAQIHKGGLFQIHGLNVVHGLK